MDVSQEFDKAREMGVIPGAEVTGAVGGSWYKKTIFQVRYYIKTLILIRSALSEAGEATNLNLAHVHG